MSDFIVHGGDDDKLNVEIAVREDGRVVVFHNRPFVDELSWLEFNLKTRRLEFMKDDGQMRDFGVLIPEHMSKYMDNTSQVYLALVSDETGKAVAARYVPLIVQRD